jgi:hypothetical protein
MLEDVRVICNECDTRTILKALPGGGYKEIRLLIAPRCKHQPVVTCRYIKAAFSRAHASTREVR